MTPRYAYQRIVPAGITASSAATGYEAEQALLQRIARPWRSDQIKDDPETIELELAASATPLAALLVQQPNRPFFLAVSADGISYSTPDFPLIWGEPNGRLKAFVVFEALTTRFVRLIFPASSAAFDGADYAEVGALYAFAAIAPLPVEPFLNTRTTRLQPQRLLNSSPGLMLPLPVGPLRTTLELALSDEDLAALEAVLDAARQDVIALDMGLQEVQLGSLVWPMRAGRNDDAATQLTNRPGQWQRSMMFREEV